MRNREARRPPCHTGAVKRWWHIPKFSLRSVDVAQRLDTFLVCAIAAVLGNRFFLILTGYPQLGNGTLHISHAIWGALMMAIAIIFAISYLPPFTRTFVAFLGGAGFGWFIDELGKFITRDVNYFFEPTIALIYIVFVVMYLVFRSVELRSVPARRSGAQRHRGAEVGVARSARRPSTARSHRPARLDRRQRRSSRPTCGRLLVDVPHAAAARARAGSRDDGDRLRARYLRWTDTRSFVARRRRGCSCSWPRLKVVSAVAFALDGTGIHGFAEWCVGDLVAGRRRR